MGAHAIIGDRRRPSRATQLIGDQDLCRDVHSALHEARAIVVNGEANWGRAAVDVRDWPVRPIKPESATNAADCLRDATSFFQPEAPGPRGRFRSINWFTEGFDMDLEDTKGPRVLPSLVQIRASRCLLTTSALRA